MSTMSNPAAGRLILMVGAPGTGKSHLARQIANRLDAVLVQTDAVRKELFPSPSYTPREMGAVYGLCHRRLEEGLRAGRVVIFDATSLRERTRSTVYRLAERCGASLLVVAAHAHVGVIRERLASRMVARSYDDLSDADWTVYRRMVTGAEPIRRPHLIANTSVSPEPVLRLLERTVLGVAEARARE